MSLKSLMNTPPWEWPANADRTLLGVLRDPKAVKADRLIAAELAGEYSVINDELAETLLALVLDGDEPADLRGIAVIALGPALEGAEVEGFDELEDTVISKEVFRRIQESLRTLFLDDSLPKDLRRRVLEASVRAPQEWHSGAVRTAFSSSDETWVLSAVFCMRYIHGFEREILDTLKTAQGDILYEAVCAAGMWELDEAWPLIARLANRKTEKFLLLAAIEALGSIRRKEAPDIVGEFADSDDEDISEAAMEILLAAAEDDDYPDEED